MTELQWVKEKDAINGKVTWHLMVRSRKKWHHIGIVYPNGVWFVNSTSGRGGQNSVDADIQKAKDAVVHCAIQDGFMPGVCFVEGGAQ